MMDIGRTVLPPALITRVIAGEQTRRRFATFVRGVAEGTVKPDILGNGQRVGRYEIQEQIGEGGFSRVYRARHVYLDFDVAIKTLATDETRARSMFLREAQSLARLRHPNVVRILDADIMDGVACIVLELLIGTTLADVVRDVNVIPIDRALDLLEDVTSVLARQEQERILHLDIKPANIFALAGGSFCVLDYGITGGVTPGEVGSYSSLDITVAQAAFGTPGYMAPEQARGRADHRSDIYSLGLTAWEVLAGRRARSEPTNRVSASAITDQSVPRLRDLRSDVPPGVDQIIAEMMEPAVAFRYQTAGDVLEDIRHLRYKGRTPAGAVLGNAFVATPFSTAFDASYESIATACLQARLRPRRLDHEAFLRDVWDQCVQEIRAATIVIADLSPVVAGAPNPNVVTEAAHARAIGKPLVVVTRSGAEELPFDWRQVQVLKYEPTAEGLDALVPRLEHYIQSLLGHTRAQSRH
jgi:tRNA A-37 threonylcarbamoyl transferase component Bud32